MTVLHVVPYFAPAWAFGGVCRAASDLSRAQARAGHRVVVLTTDALSRTARLPAGELDVDGVRVIRLRNVVHTARARLNLSTPRGLAATVRRLLDDADVVHCHELRTVETLRACRVGAAGGAAIVLSPHGTLTYATGRRRAKRIWDALFARRTLPAFDAVLALTGSERAQVQALWASYGVPLAAERMPVIPNGVDICAFLRLPAREDARARWALGSGPVVLFLGRVAPRKGLSLLVEAFATLASGFPRARLLVAGPDEGAEAAARAAVRRLGIADRVVFAGPLSGDARLAAFAAADVFALPAAGEGFSVAALEALACRVPVVLSPDCGFQEVAEQGAGVIAAPSAPALADALRDLLGDRPRLAEMRERAWRLAGERYSWANIAPRVDAAYRSAIAWRQARNR
jgi:glycosyltransferase involved in cell wall biosynthesis